MKKLYFILLLFVIHGWNTKARSQGWLWAHTADAVSQSMCTDAYGNVLVTGEFKGPTITFGTTILTNANWGTGYDMFVVKYDPSGNVLWAKSAGGVNSIAGNAIATDGYGNVLVAGEFWNTTVIFGTDTLTSTGANLDIFVVKYDPSGNVVWARSAGGTYYDMVDGISVDGNGNVLIAGGFQCPSITFGTTTLYDSITYDIDMFIVKYDAAGNVLWAKSAGGVSHDRNMDVSTDASGNAVVTGFFDSPSIIFGTDTLINAGAGGPQNSEIYVVKYDPSGNVLWARSANGISTDQGYGIATDLSGNVLVTGRFESPSITFSGTVLSNSGVSLNDLFVVKYDASGNVLWAKSIDGSSNGSGPGIASDASENVLVTGFFQTASITLGTIVLTCTNQQKGSDVFMVKYDPSGNVLWAESAGGTGTDDGYDICSDAGGNVLVSGLFADSIRFGTTTLYNPGNINLLNMFVAKIDHAAITNIGEENHPLFGVTVFPNPSNGQFNIASYANMDEIKITNITGQIIFHSSPNKNNISFQLDEAGIYFIQIMMKDQTVTKKIIVSR